MNEVSEYQERLEETLEECACLIKRNAMDELQVHVKEFARSVSNIYKTLLEKGVIRKDPYQEERSIAKFKVPSREEFTEKEANREMSTRLSFYVSQWEYIGNVFHLDLENLDLNIVRSIKALTSWVQWSDFSIHSSSIITRSLADFVEVVLRSKDVLARKLITSALSTVKEEALKINKILDVITVYLKEHYKLRVRNEIMSRLNIDAGLYPKFEGKILAVMKASVSKMKPALFWEVELAEEILQEDFSSNGEEHRENVFKRLNDISSLWKKEEDTDEPDAADQLLDIALQLSHSSAAVNTAISRMRENSRTLEERPKSFVEILNDFLAKLFQKEETSLIYSIPMKDMRTGFIRHESLDFAKFMSRAVRCGSALQKMKKPEELLKGSNSSMQVDAMEKYLNKVLSELKYVHKHLEGLDAFFHSNAIPENIADKMKSCSLNTDNIKASVSMSLKSLTKYQSNKEAKEQLRKLGVNQ